MARTSDGSKMMPCPACCPARPELGYRRAGMVRHEQNFVEVDGEFVWAWQCWNCGHVKKPRAKRQTTDYEYITERAQTDEKMSVYNAIRFHYFNPNGILGELQKLHKKIDRVVELTGCPNGVYFVHGSLNTFPHDELRRLYELKTRATTSDLYVWKKMTRETIDAGERWVNDKLTEYQIYSIEI